MTTLTEQSRVQYTASGGQINFGFPFKIFLETDLKVYLTPVGQTPNPSIDILTLTTDYTVNILDQTGSIDLVVAATAGDIVTIERDVPATRTDDFEVGGRFSGDILDNQLDKITIEQAQIKSIQNNRQLTYEVTDVLTSSDTDLPKLAANQYWVKNNSGNLVAGECTDTDGCSTLRSELASETVLAPGTDNVGYYDAVDLGQTLTEKLADMVPQKDDRAVVKNATDETKLVKINASAVSTGTTRTISMPDYDVDLAGGISNNLFLDGFPPDLAVGDPNHDVTISDGSAMDSTHSRDIVFSGTMTKQIDANWAAGDNQGGFPSGLTLTANVWYHLFVIMKEDGTVDFGWDSSLSATNLLADATDYIYYRRIGSNVLTGALNFYGYIFKQEGKRRVVYFTPPLLVYAASNPGNSAVLVNAGVPTGIEAYSMFNAILDDSTATNHGMYVANPDCTDLAPSLTVAPLETLRLDSACLAVSQYFEMLTNAAGFVRFRIGNSNASTTVRFCTLGWSEHL